MNNRKDREDPKFKGRTQSGRNRRPKDDRNNERPRVSKHNDPNWYLVNGQLAKDVASFSFNNALGDVVRTVQDVNVEGTYPSGGFTVPGIATVLTAPTVGVSLSKNSPVNVAAQNIYSFVRHENSGHANYDPVDLMIYLLTIDSIQTYWSYLVRLYGVTQLFNQRNRYVGDRLIAAMGADPVSVRSNIAELRAYINQFAIKASVLAAPSGMNYFTRHAWMYQNVYMDENNAKAQMFLYAPAYLYKYSIMDNDAGGLEPIFIAASMHSTRGHLTNSLPSRTFNDLQNIGDDMINAALSQEDVGIISGDIIKAYKGNIFSYVQIDASYVCVPVYSEEVLAQFHNTDFLGRSMCYLKDGTYTIDVAEAAKIRQDTSIGSGVLMFQPSFAGCTELSYTHILDLWTDDVTPELALVATRNMLYTTTIRGSSAVFKDGSTGGGLVSNLVSAGSELVFDVCIQTIAGNSVTYTWAKSTGATETVPVDLAPISTKFNQFPLVRGFVTTTGVQMPLGEMSNYYALSLAELNPMHTSALLSLFGVPYRW